MYSMIRFPSVFCTCWFVFPQLFADFLMFIHSDLARCIYLLDVRVFSILVDVFWFSFAKKRPCDVSGFNRCSNVVLDLFFWLFSDSPLMYDMMAAVCRSVNCLLMFIVASLVWRSTLIEYSFSLSILVICFVFLDLW